MQITTQALVIRVTDTGENDRLLTLLTKNNGIVKAFASNAKKINNKYYSATSLFCYSDFTLRFVKGSYRVSDAALKHSFFKIGSDVKALSLCQYFCEVAEALSPPDTNSEDLLRLILNTFHLMFPQKKYLPLLKAIFELRSLSISGYMPDLVGCRECGNFFESEMYFYSDEGALSCRKCKRVDDKGIYLDATLISAMRYIVYVDFEKIFSFEIPNEKADRLSKITESFIISQTERKFRTLDFYYSMD